jgi:hypothetical protein
VRWTSLTRFEIWPAMLVAAMLAGVLAAPVISPSPTAQPEALRR